MKASSVFWTLALADWRNVRRDSLLAWIPVIPLVMALAMRLGIPAIAVVLKLRYGLDLAPYYPLFVSIFLVTAPQVVGMVVGFLLLDERDERVLSALLVTPLPVYAYLFYRISLPAALALVVTLAGTPLVGLSALPPVSFLAAAVLASLTCPIMALFLVAFAENKVAGFAYVKFVNAIMLLPLVAYFLPLPWQYLAGIIPAYWPLKVFWLGGTGAGFGAQFLAGLAVNLVALFVLLRRVTVVLHR